MARDFPAELAAAREIGDWSAHERIWEERRVGSVEADEASLDVEYAPGEKVIYRGALVEIDSRYENSGDYLVLCSDGYRQANPQELSRPAQRPPVDWTGVRAIHERRDAAAAAAKAAVPPFSTYPEDRAKLLDLARKCEKSDDANAVELGDLVRAILEDEQVSL